MKPVYRHFLAYLMVCALIIMIVPLPIAAEMSEQDLLVLADAAYQARIQQALAPADKSKASLFSADENADSPAVNTLGYLAVFKDIVSTKDIQAALDGIQFRTIGPSSAKTFWIAGSDSDVFQIQASGLLASFELEKRIALAEQSPLQAADIAVLDESRTAEPDRTLDSSYQAAITRILPAKSGANQPGLNMPGGSQNIWPALSGVQAALSNVVIDDPLAAQQWAIDNMCLVPAWEHSTGSDIIRIAVIDTGIYAAHEDFEGTNILYGWDFVGGHVVSGDVLGHGTMVAGVIAATTGNGKGIAGICLDCTILPLQVFRADGFADEANIIDAIYFAADSGCKVINLSLGSPEASSAENNAVQYALSKGCIVVAAAGNTGDSTPQYPASYEGVVSVAAHDDQNKFADFTTYNSMVIVSAPGVDIIAPFNNGSYVYASGTSLAAPQVSGLAGLAAAMAPGVTPAAFHYAVRSTCIYFPDTPSYIHFGILNADNLLEWIRDTEPSRPPVTSSQPVISPEAYDWSNPWYDSDLDAFYYDFTFTPDVTGSYSFVCQTNYDWDIYVFDQATQAIIDYDDSVYPFWLAMNLQAGKTYYIVLILAEETTYHGLGFSFSRPRNITNIGVVLYPPYGIRLWDQTLTVNASTAGRKVLMIEPGSYTEHYCAYVLDSQGNMLSSWTDPISTRSYLVYNGPAGVNRIDLIKTEGSSGGYDYMIFEEMVTMTAGTVYSEPLVNGDYLTGASFTPADTGRYRFQASRPDATIERFDNATLTPCNYESNTCDVDLISGQTTDFYIYTNGTASSQTYSIRKLSPAATLTGISGNAGVLHPSFSPATTDYTLELGSYAGPVTLSAASGQSGTIISMNSIRRTSLVVNPLPGESQQVQILVTSEDTLHQTLYTVNVHRPSGQCGLISIDSGNSSFWQHAAPPIFGMTTDTNSIGLSFTVDEGASSALYSDAACTQIVDVNAPNLVDGLNELFLKIVAENGSDFQIWSFLLYKVPSEGLSPFALTTRDLSGRPIADGGLTRFDVLLYAYGEAPFVAEGTLNGQPLEFSLTDPLTEEGIYTITVSDQSASSRTISVTIDKTPPVISGVEQDGVYYASPNITFTEGTATLDGQPFTSGQVITAAGNYTLILSDAAGNQTTVSFSLLQRTIVFNSQGGSAVANGHAFDGALLSEPTRPAQTGYTFAGWFKDTGLTQPWVFASDTVSGDMTLYARWTINQYTVSFNSQGGSNVTAKITNYNTSITAPAAPARTGFTFAGWYKEAGCTNAWNFAADKVVSNTTLYAKWTINQYTVSFNSMSGTSVAAKVANYSTAISAPAAPTRSGYLFVGWYKESGWVNAWNFATDKVTGNTTLYARWLQTSAAGLTAISAGYDSILLTWTATSGANGYAIYRAASSAGTYTLVGTATANRYTSGGLATNTTYYYKILAYATLGASKVKSGYSAAVSAKPVPAAPAGLVAVPASYSSIQLTWNAVPGASGYAVYRATSLAGTYSLVTSSVTATTYMNTGRSTGTTYYYKVKAYRLVGTTKVYGAYSSAASAKTILNVPVNLKAASASYSSIKLTWAAVAGASGYAIYRSTSLTGTYSYVTSTSYLAYTNTSRLTGTTYYYKIRAYRLVGTTRVYSGYTGVVSAAPILSTPAAFTAVRYSTTSIKLTWSAVSGRTGYEVWQATSATGTYALVKTTTYAYFTMAGLTTGKTYYYKVRAYRLVGTVKVYGVYTVVRYATP